MNLTPCLSPFGRPLLVVLALIAASVPRLHAQTPVNDAFAARLVLTGSTNSVTGNNTNATSEPGEPVTPGGDRSIWWSWTAADSGAVTVDTTGSTFDTILAVYTGTEITNLTLVAMNDDFGVLSTSGLGFAAVGGVTYQIAVQGFIGAQGSVALNVRLPVATTRPSFTTQPVSRTVPDNAGSNVSFVVALTGSLPRTLQWQKDGIALPNATNLSLTLGNPRVVDAGSYRAVAGNPYGSATSSVAVLTVQVALAQDAFAGRLVLSGQTNSASSDNTVATLEAGEPVHGGVPCGASVWWTWTALANGLVQLDTAGSSHPGGAPLATVLAVYTGTNVANLTPVTANEDAVRGVAGDSQVLFRAQAGRTYQIAVAGVNDPFGQPATGIIALHLAQLPDNDFFVNALLFPTNAVSVRDNNVGATLEPGEPANIVPGDASVWWFWVCPTNGHYTIDTGGSAVATLLCVYQFSTLGALTLVAEDDQGSDRGDAAVKVQAVGGTTYYLAVKGPYTNGVPETGDLRLNVNPSLSVNDNFADRFTLTGVDRFETATNIGATEETNEPDHAGNLGGKSVWWSWPARQGGTVTITTAGSSFDTLLAVYTGHSLAALSLVAANDDADNLDPLARSKVTFTAVAGVTYQIAVDGYRFPDGEAAEGAVELHLHEVLTPYPGGNDYFADRYAITGGSVTVTGDNTKATKEPGEPGHAGSEGGDSLWWSWVAPASGAVVLTTVGSSFDTVLAVYTGNAVAALTFVAADRDSGLGGECHLTFTAVAGVQYQIAVDGYRDGNNLPKGLVVLNLAQFGSEPQHANDSFVLATLIPAQFPDVSGYNVAATREPGEPSHGGMTNGHSIWWAYRATANGAVTVSTEGSDFDTILSVYTGSNVAALTLVAENDDRASGNRRSRVTFQGVAGIIYKFAVDGYGGQQGYVRLGVLAAGEGATAPEIQEPPVDFTSYAGGEGTETGAHFRVRATGTPPLTYQWQRNGLPVPGATNDTFTLDPVVAAEAGIYRVDVSNAYGSVFSAAALRFVAEPFNDLYAQRILLVGSSNRVFASNLRSGADEAEEYHPGVQNGGHSVWWRWVAPTNGPVEVSTAGSSFETLLGVYVGSTLGSLQEVAYNIMAVRDVLYFSRMIFNAVAGQEYEIAVGSSKPTDAGSGSIVLKLQQFPGAPVLQGPTRTADGHFQFLITGSPGAQIRVQQSTDLRTYSTVFTAYLPPGGLVFVDPELISTLPQRYFRVLSADVPVNDQTLQTTLPVYTNVWDQAHIRVCDKVDGLYANANELYLAYLRPSFPWVTNLQSILGKSVYTFYDTAQGDDLLARENQVLADGVTAEYLYALQPFGQATSWAYMKKSALRDDQGRNYAVRTEFYEIPAPNQTVVPAATNDWQRTQLFVVDKDTNSVIINANSNYVASLQGNFPEIHSVTNLIGRDDYYFYAPAEADKFRADDHQVMTSGVGYHALEANQQIGGQMTYLYVTKTPLRDFQGKVFGVHLEFFAVPELTLHRVAGGGAELSWPADQSVYHVQESAAANGPWTDSLATPVISGGQFRVAVTPVGGRRFYRLLKNP